MISIKHVTVNNFNQRFYLFFLLDKNFTVTASLGSILKRFQIEKKFFRNNNQGLSFFYMFIKELMAFSLKQQLFKRVLNFCIFSGFSRKLFFFFSKFFLLLFGLSNNSIFLFLPSYSFSILKTKKYKAIKKAYRRSIIKVERQISF